MCMRVHMILDDELVDEIDELAGPRGRTAFIADALRREVDEQRRWRLIRAMYGTISDSGHDWDSDPAKWVHDSRRNDPRHR